MQDIYKIHDNSNMFYTLVSVVFRWYTQLNCEHDWRQKGFGTMEHDFASTNEIRCAKCKKIKFSHFLKL